MLTHIATVLAVVAASVFTTMAAAYLLLAAGCRQGIEDYYGA